MPFYKLFTAVTDSAMDCLPILHLCQLEPAYVLLRQCLAALGRGSHFAHPLMN